VAVIILLLLFPRFVPSGVHVIVVAPVPTTQTSLGTITITTMTARMLSPMTDADGRKLFLAHPELMETHWGKEWAKQLGLLGIKPTTIPSTDP
jgi:hypothetical protein